MSLVKIIITLFIIMTTLFSFNLSTNSVEKLKWQHGETLLSFLEDNSLPLKLYYDLSGEDKKVIRDILEGTTYYVVKDCSNRVYQALIPLNEELEIHIYRDMDGEYQLKIIPIDYQTQTKTVLVEIDSTFLNSILKSTHNFPLALSLKSIYRGSINFKKLKKGDKVAIKYIEKTWMDEKFGTQRVLATYYKHKKRKIYKFFYKGKYYDQRGNIKIKKSYFITPCRYRRISDRFTKKRWHPILHRYRPHNGIDYANRRGTPIWATYQGVVVYAGWVRGYGRYIEIKHPNGYHSVYGHLSKIKVRRGQRVKKHQVIGLMGSSGLSTGSHLHFGIKKGSTWINPANKIYVIKRKSLKERRKILSIIRKYKRELDNLDIN